MLKKFIYCRERAKEAWSLYMVGNMLKKFIYCREHAKKLVLLQEVYIIVGNMLKKVLLLI
jgi:hypothetical protein